ncbi:hypothetical protein FBU30_000575 [Linnemannia zychae]|nr:hypothetical protein FBU30_000575 [Linnemannia zychae]
MPPASRRSSAQQPQPPPPPSPQQQQQRQQQQQHYVHNQPHQYQGINLSSSSSRTSQQYDYAMHSNQFSGVNSRSSSSAAYMSPNREMGASLVAPNPYWSEYQQVSQQPTLPLNYYTSTTQHQQNIAPMVPPEQPVLAPSELTRKEPQVPSTVPPAKPLNQNQVHAQTHPWRIKVYNACLACRKKKIKCDGQPTCQRCQRLGFECSYIEVPQTPVPKINNKPKAKGNLNDETLSAAASVSSKRHYHHTVDSPSESLPSSTSIKAAKEIRQQRRSSTKDAASGSFPHSTTRRKDALLTKDTSINQSIVQPVPPQTSGKEQQKPFSDMTPTPNVAKPMGSFVLDRDTSMPDLYHILVNSVTIPNVSKYTQTTQNNTPLATGLGGGAVLMGMDQLNLTLASPIFPTFTVLNSDHTDPEQHHSTFQKDPTLSSFLDQAAPLGFVITNKSVIQYLVHVYFECFHQHWMIVDKQKFLAQLKDPASPPDPLLLVAICAAGAKYSDHEGLCAEPGNLSTIGEQFLTHARILLQDRFDMPSMSTLQALLILYWCQVQTGRASLRFMYVGMAIRMAQEIGLNRPLDAKRLKDMDEREVQIRKTIWWSCYQADRWTSAALGKPMVISDVDCVVDYPTSVDPSEKCYIESFCYMTDLAKVLGKIILHLYTSTNASTCSSAVFSQLDQSLSTWITSIPPLTDRQETSLPTPISLESASDTPTRKTNSPHPHQRGRSVAGSKSGTPDNLQPSAVDDSASEPSSVGYCALLYHTARIMLYRPFLHNRSTAPALPLTLQSPLSRCRESAIAISEIAETMVTDQYSYRQLFNSIHFSLCAAATIHRFVLVSPKDSLDLTSSTTIVEVITPTGDGNSSTLLNTSTISSKGPVPPKSDLYYLATLLRILQSCCRFSVEKHLLRSIIDTYLPQQILNAESLAWALEEVHRPLPIVPFTIKLPFQTPSGTRSMVALNLSSEPTSQQPQLQQQRPISISRSSPKQRSDQQETPIRQYQQYQQRLRQQQLNQQNKQHQKQRQQQQKQEQQQQEQHQTSSRRFNGPPTITSMLSDTGIAPFTSSTADKMALRQERPTLVPLAESAYVTNLTADSIHEEYQMQQYQHELDLLQEHHRKQQSELSQHHHQQTLQLQQAQLYQQQQQHQEHEKQQELFAREQQLQQQHYEPSHQNSAFAGNSSVPGHASARNKRQSDASSKGLNKHQDHHYNHQQDQPQPSHPQQVQSLSQQDSYMTDATPPDLDPRVALAGMTGSDEIMTMGSAPPVISQRTGTSDLSGQSGMASLDELLGLESAGYYPDLPTEDNNNPYVISTSNLPIAGPSSAEEQSQTRHTGSSNASERLWYGNNNNGNTPSRGSFSIDSNNNSPGGGQGNSGNQSHRSSIGSDNSGIQRDQSYNSRGGHSMGDSAMVPSGPMNTTWLGMEQVNTSVSGGTNQLPPHRQGEITFGYPYPYAFTYTAQPTLPPLPPLGQAQPIPYTGYIARSISYSPAHPYVYGGDGSAPMGVYVPAPIPPATQRAPAFEGAGLVWQQHPQFAVPHTILSPQMAVHQNHNVQMYSPRVVHHGHPGQQQIDQSQAPRPQQYHHQQQQPEALQSQALVFQQQDGQQQQQQAASIYVLKPTQQELQQQRQHQQELNQQRKVEQVRHPSATLLPPPPQNVFRQESRPFSPSSNTTLVNTTSNSSSSTQQEGYRSSSSGREASTGGDSSVGHITSDSQFESSQSISGDSNRQSRSAGSGSSMEGSNESSSNTESPNSTEDVSNSNESGSSSDNNPGSRSSSADPAVALISSGDGSGSGSGSSGNSGATSKTSRGQKTVSSGSGDSSSDLASSTSPPSKTETHMRQQHYRAHQQSQEAGSGDSSSSSSGGGSAGSGRSNSMSSSNGGSNTGSNQSGSRRRRKSNYRGGNGSSLGGGGHGPNDDSGDTGGASGNNNNSSTSANTGSSQHKSSDGSGGRSSQTEQSGNGGSRHSSNTGSGSNTGLSNNPGAKSISSHLRQRNNSGGGNSVNQRGRGSGSSHGSEGGGSRNRSNRKGKGNNINNTNNINKNNNNNGGAGGSGGGKNSKGGSNTKSINYNVKSQQHRTQPFTQPSAVADPLVMRTTNGHGGSKKSAKQHL